MCLPVIVDRPERLLAKGVHMDHEWVVTHNGRGSRCGYVKVSPGHPWYGQQLDKCDRCDEVKVHGGVTYAEPDEACGNGADDGWWLGFDACHGGDLPDPELPGSRTWDSSRNFWKCRMMFVRPSETFLRACGPRNTWRASAAACASRRRRQPHRS